MRDAIRRSPASLRAFVDHLQSRGRYTFTREEARSALHVSAVALQASARRLLQRARLAAPRRGFYVIVPLEYRAAGAPPPSWYVDDLMRAARRPYYVALLTAASLHGAAPQQPQEFQVMTDVPLRIARAGRSTLRFFVKGNLGPTPVQVLKTETGGVRVSTAEATAFDLVGYPEAAGHLGNVAAVLEALAERLDAKKLAIAGDLVKLPVVQRAGYLLDRAGHRKLTELLHRRSLRRGPRPVGLRTGVSPVKSRLDGRWRVLVNQVMERDE